MIIQSDKILEIGNIYIGLVSDLNLEYKKSAFKVIRISSREEFKEFIRQYNCVDTGEYSPYFYEVQPD